MPAENVAMVAAFLFAAVTSSTGLAAIKYGETTPDFTVTTSPHTKRLSDLRGKPVVLNFWASWCHPCTDELKHFVRAEQLYGKQIDIVTISSEYHDVAASYLRLWNIELPLTEDPDGSIGKAYSVPPIPVTIVLDAQGRVSYVSVGELSWNELKDAVEKVLAPGAVGSPASGVLR